MVYGAHSCDCYYDYLESAAVDCDSCYHYCFPETLCGLAVCDVTTLYEDASYGGDSWEVEVEDDCLPFIPGSICVPEGHSVELFGYCNFDGGSVDVDSSNEDLGDLIVYGDDTAEFLTHKTDVNFKNKVKKDIDLKDIKVKVLAK